MFPDNSTPCYQKASARDAASSLTGARFTALPAQLVCLQGNEAKAYALPDVRPLL